MMEKASLISYYDINKPITSFEGLENSIYQVNYWMETLKEILEQRRQYDGEKRENNLQ